MLLGTWVCCILQLVLLWPAFIIVFVSNRLYVLTLDITVWGEKHPYTFSISLININISVLKYT